MNLIKTINVTMKSRDNSNLSICEKLMGHSVTVQLDNNYAPFSNEKLFTEYKKAIPELTISNDERQKIQLENKNKEITKLESDKSELMKIKEENSKFKKELFSKILPEGTDLIKLYELYLNLISEMALSRLMVLLFI